MKQLPLANNTIEIIDKDYIKFHSLKLNMNVGEEFIGTLGTAKYSCKVVEKIGSEYKCEFKLVK